MPQDVTDPPKPFSNPNPGDEIPFVSSKAPSQNKTSGTRGKKELTSVEEVKEYLKLEAAKEKASKASKSSKCPTPYSLPLMFIIVTKSLVHENLNYKKKSVANICVHFPFASFLCLFSFSFLDFK